MFLEMQDFDFAQIKLN